MNLLKTINEEASESHIKEEKDYFEYGIKCLKGLIEFCEDEKRDADEEGRKKDYSSIKKLSKHLIDEMQSHLDSYESSSS